MTVVALTPAPGRRTPSRSVPVPLATLEELLAVAAYIVVRHGDAYMPTFVKMERLVEEERSTASVRRRAELLLAGRMKVVPVAGGVPA